MHFENYPKCIVKEVNASMNEFGTHFILNSSILANLIRLFWKLFQYG